MNLDQSKGEGKVIDNKTTTSNTKPDDCIYIIKFPDGSYVGHASFDYMKSVWKKGLARYMAANATLCRLTNDDPQTDMETQKR